MTEEKRRENLAVPVGKVDVVLDTDAFNEIDDQYAIVYLLRSAEKLSTKAIYAAPFFKEKVASPKEGMEKSYEEILRVLALLDEKREVFYGSEAFLPDEKTPVESPAARDLVDRAKKYSPDRPLYVIAIGAITNIASAILMDREAMENTVILWLGGNAQHYHDNFEFNMRQDVAAARVVFSSGIPLIQLPCRGVVSEFILTLPEIEAYLDGKTKISSYLAQITKKEMARRKAEKIWSKPIWDVTAVAYLLNENDRFMYSRQIAAPQPGYDLQYEPMRECISMQYVYHIKRDDLMRDLIAKLNRE